MTTSPKLQKNLDENPNFNIHDAVANAMEAEAVAPVDLSVVIEMGFDQLQDIIDKLEGACAEEPYAMSALIEDITTVQLAIGEFAVLK